MSNKASDKKSMTRREFLGISTGAAIGGIVGGVVVGAVGGYLAGQAAAPTTQPTTVTQTVTRTSTVTSEVTVGGKPVVGRKLSTAVVVPGRANDVGWNQQGVDSLKRAADLFRAGFSFSENLGYGEAPIRAMEDYIRRETDLIVAHAGGYRTGAIDIVRGGRTGVSKFLIVASEVGEEQKRDLIPGAMATYSFEPAEAAYIAGALAGLVTKSNVIGIVQSVESDTYWLRQSGGFAQGVKDTNPRARLLFTVVGDYEEAVRAKEYTLAQIDQGADVIFGMGDGASFGMMEACSERKTWFIDVIGDKRSIDEAGILLTSVLWDFTPAFQRAIADIYNGSFGTENYEISFFNGAIDLLEINRKISPDIRAKVDGLRESVRKGAKKVERVITREQFYDLLKRLGFA